MMMWQTHSYSGLDTENIYSIQVVPKKCDCYTPSQYCMLPEDNNFTVTLTVECNLECIVKQA